MTPNADSVTVVQLVGGPYDGRTYNLRQPALELHFGGRYHRYRVTADRTVFEYVDPELALPARP